LAAPAADESGPVETTERPGASALALDDPLPLDPAVRMGRLDNGLTYYVQHNDKPLGRAELWLVVNAGSVLEQEGEQGLAHFVEHMLFNGTRRFPELALIDTLERMGMEFGPDVNAYTSPDETVYMLQVPTDQADLLQAGLDVLEDWAAFATLSDEEIDKERGVVIEEQRLTEQNAGGRIWNQTWPALTAGTVYTDRLPIGDMDVIRSAPADAVRAFYRTWYRPDLMAVIAVGDFDAGAMEDQVRQRFAALPQPDVAQPRPEPSGPTARPRRFLLLADPEYPTTDFSIDHVGLASPLRTAGDFRRWLVDTLAGDIFNARLEEIGRQPDAPFLYAYGGSEPLARQVQTFSVSGQTQEGQVLAGIEAVLTEIERVRQHGFGQQEMERARADLALSYQLWLTEKDNLDSAVFAQGYSDHFLSGAASPSVDLAVGLVQQWLPEISLDEVAAAFRVLAPPDGQLVNVTAPDKEGVALPDGQELAALFEQVGSAALTPNADSPAVRPLMDQAPPPVEIVAEQTYQELGISQFTLANGVQVIVKPTDFWADDIVFSATSPGGTSLAEDEDFPEAAAVAHLVAQSGAGELSQSELDALLAGKAAQAAPGIYETSEGFSGYATAQDLELAFQLIYLYATAPRLDPAAVQVYRNQAQAALVNRTVMPDAAMQDALVDALYGETPRRGPLTLGQIDAFDAERALAIYRERFADMSDFTFTFVGNVDEVQIRDLARRYLGALPGGGREETWRAVAPLALSGVDERTVVRGQEEQSIVQLVFTGPFSPTRESEVQMEALEALLSIRLRDELREARSGTYVPFVSSSLSLAPGPEYMVWVGFGADPQRVDELVAALFTQVADLQTNGPSSEELAKVQEQLRRNREEALQDNNFWLWIIEQHFSTPGQDPEDILAYDGLLAALQPADVQAAAQRFLPLDRYARVTLLPEGYAQEP
jgi:zinc protease